MQKKKLNLIYILILMILNTDSVLNEIHMIQQKKNKVYEWKSVMTKVYCR